MVYFVLKFAISVRGGLTFSVHVFVLLAGTRVFCFTCPYVNYIEMTSLKRRQFLKR